MDALVNEWRSRSQGLVPQSVLPECVASMVFGREQY
jgi:hypothetical protein